MANKPRQHGRVPKAAPTSVPVETGPQWIIEMRDHYQKTGAYRADDLARVLGDPRDGVEIRGSGDVLYAGRVQE